MYVDSLQLVCDAQQFTATGVSASSIDLTAVLPNREIGEGEPLGFKVSILNAGVNTGSVVASIISSAAAALTAPNIVDSIGLATTDLAKGKEFFIPLPPQLPHDRYIGVQLTVTGVVDVTVQAELTLRSMQAGKAKSYAAGYKITG